MINRGRSIARRERPIAIALNQKKFSDNDDSGFFDESLKADPYDVDPSTASSIVYSHSSRKTASSASPYVPTSQPQYSPPDDLCTPQELYRYQQQHQLSIPSIASLLTSTSGPNPHTMVETTGGEDKAWSAKDLV